MAEAVPPATIGLPVYNGERYLAETLRTLLDQTDGDFTLLVADNASTDGTVDIVRDAARHDGRVRLLPADANRGVAWNWNRIVDHVESPYLRWVCYDDLFLADNHRVCMETVAEVGPDVAIVYPRTGIIDEHGTYVGPHDDDLHLVDPRPSARYGRYLVNVRQVNPLFGVIRTDLVRRTRLMGAYFRADTVLLAELVLRGTFVEVPDELFHRRLHPGISTEKHTSHREQAIHYDPSTGDRSFYAPHWRLGKEQLAAIARAPLSAVETARCLRELRNWRYKRHVLREGRAVAVELAAQLRPRTPVG